MIAEEGTCWVAHRGTCPARPGRRRRSAGGHGTTRWTGHVRRELVCLWGTTFWTARGRDSRPLLGQDSDGGDGNDCCRALGRRTYASTRRRLRQIEGWDPVIHAIGARPESSET